MKTKLLLLLAFFAISATSFAQIVHLTGAGVGGWNNPPLAQNLMSTTDNVNFTISNVQITGSGGSAELKFMVNSDWNTTYGFSAAPGWPSGVAAAPGTNIPGVAGFWNVAFNLTTKAYSFTPGVNPNPEIKIAGTSTNPASGIVLTTSNGINYSLPSVTLTAGNAKFNQSSSPNSWGGTAFPAGTAATSTGTAITIPAGTYNISFNRNTGAYSFQNTSVALIGDFNSWSADEAMTTTNAVTYTKTGLVIPSNGNIKFRDNGNWTYGFGGSTNPSAFPTGTAASPGNDIPITAGTYNVSFNRSTFAYTFQTLSTENFQKYNFDFFPNPTKDSWNFSSTSNALESISIIDVLGKTVIAVTPNSLQATVDATSLTPGVYFAKVSANNKVQTVKLVKQ